tara:strand:- start:2052 stop:3233 length:1182 start_codon:yes stop_codon:yes gene_type:complete
MNNDNYIISGWEDEKLSLNIKLIRGIYSNGFENPSSIQKQVLYPMIKLKDKGKNRDIIAQAQSGTGKTGAFTVGMLELININKNKIQGIILAPTHELAEQINDVVLKLGHYLEIKSLLLVGGTSVELNKKELTNNTPHLIVGTPGRIHDMIRRKYLKVKDIKTLVIDEADEMLSSGFKEQMYKIFQYLNDDIQIGLFSATMPNELKELTKTFLQNPVKILVKPDMLTLEGISQFYINIQNDIEKYETIKDIFEAVSVSQSIIYCNSVRRVDDLTEAMKGDNFPVEKMHGKMTEQERKETFKLFKQGHCRVLITSDLFARGIDIQQVSIVINFDIPKNEYTYLHRIGRSGRWGRKGIAINFQTKYDISKLKYFEKYYNTEIVEMPLNFHELIAS